MPKLSLRMSPALDCTGQHVLNQQLLGTSLAAALSALAAAGTTNLARLRPEALLQVVLPAAMPSAWRGAGIVQYQREACPGDDESQGAAAAAKGSSSVTW